MRDDETVDDLGEPFDEGELDPFIRALAKAPPKAPWPLEGERVGPYRLGLRIGAGRSAIVLRATDERLGRSVAIKLLRGEHADAALREARLLAAVRDRHVLTVLDVGREGDFAYIVSELADRSLRDVLAAAKGPLPVPEVMQLGCDIARGLAALHARGMTHQDLKPENVVIDPAGVAQVADLGSSLDAREAGIAAGMGTPGYIAPERTLNPDAADARSDVYALGVILREMGALRVVTLRSLVGRMLAAEPALRPSLAEVIRVLSEPRRRRNGVAIATFALCLVAGVVLVRCASDPAPHRVVQAFVPETHQAPQDPVGNMAVIGHHLAYTTRDAIVVRDLERGREHSLPIRAQTVAWLASDTLLVRDAASRLARVNSATGEATELSWGPGLFVPSAQGDYLAWFSESSDPSEAEGRLYARVGDELRFVCPLPEASGASLQRSSAFSSDGSLVAYVGRGSSTAVFTLRAMDIAQRHSVIVADEPRAAQVYGTPAFAWDLERRLVVALSASGDQPSELVRFVFDVSLRSEREPFRALPEDRTLDAMAYDDEGNLLALRVMRDVDVVAVTEGESAERAVLATSAREWPIARLDAEGVVTLSDFGEHLALVAVRNDGTRQRLTAATEDVVAAAETRVHGQQAIAYLARDAERLTLRSLTLGGEAHEITRLPGFAMAGHPPSDWRDHLACARDTARCVVRIPSTPHRAEFRTINLSDGATLDSFEVEEAQVARRGMALRADGTELALVHGARHCVRLRQLDGSVVSESCSEGATLQSVGFVMNELWVSGLDAQRGWVAMTFSAQGPQTRLHGSGWLHGPIVDASVAGVARAWMGRTSFVPSVVRLP